MSVMSRERSPIRVTEAVKERFTFFFGNASPFSQWHPAQFTVDGIEYCCAEQYMMHQKAGESSPACSSTLTHPPSLLVLFKDQQMAEKILATSEPRKQKALGRRVSNFDKQVWKENCKDVVRTASRAKFDQNPALMEALLATAGTTLVEASPRDRIWGIGLSANNKKALDRATWRGTNWLGEILTQIRDELEHTTPSK